MTGAGGRAQNRGSTLQQRLFVGVEMSDGRQWADNQSDGSATQVKWYEWELREIIFESDKSGNGSKEE